MRNLIFVACLSGSALGAAAFVPAFVLPSAGFEPAETALRASRLNGQAKGTQFTLPMTSIAAGVALFGLFRPRRAKKVRISRKAEPIEMGKIDPQTGERNYVNPFEERIDIDKDVPADAQREPSGKKFFPYTGPVYKKVPVAEGLEFPLDPNLYYPPLEPPPPGAKWGDGRAPDGNWYMDIEDEKVQYWQGVGKRKTACAIVRIVKGNGQFIVNGRDAIQYFSHYPIWWLKACEPLAALSQKNKFDIIAKSFGGGISGQAGAVRLALARAMQEYNFNWRPLMKKAKFLTRDWRMVEPKKTGQPKARKKTPYHKR
ncbi:unnamed protein product [Durusdinium trenchii]|uniref:Uncharacterized protein n=2 Tax=Durusdinium trenchii TaxID=1381693 RepID=A0ABP0KHJ6_9DINO